MVRAFRMLLERKWPSGSIGPFGEGADLTPLAAARSPAELELRDVLRNLAVLLATRRGIGHVLPNFGFSDAASSNAAKLLSTFSAELVENVRSYEPRIEILEIAEGISEDAELEIVLDAKLRSPELHFQVRVHPVRRTLELVEPS